MKTLPFLLLVVLAGASAVAADPAPVTTPGDVLGAKAAPLYVHCIGANPNGDSSSILLLTAPLVREKTLAAGGEAFVVLPAAAPSLKGRVEPRGGKFFVKLTGAFGLSQGDVEGVVEPDKRYAPSVMGYTGGVRFFNIVITHQSDPAPFLKQPFYEKGEGNVMKQIVTAKPE